MPGERLTILERLPKAELHLHLDGSLRPTTALELARQRGLDGGMDQPAMSARLRAPDRCLDQADLLRAFDLPIAIMQDAASLAQITHELVWDVATEGTRYAEIRWAPGLHVQRGLGLLDGIAAVVAGCRSGMVAAAAAGHPCEARLIAVAMRSHPPATSVDVARAAARYAGEVLTGFDLAGPEAAYPDPLLHRDAFAIAREAGLGITLHAGEWGGAAQVWRALELEPARIAHGAPAGDDPALQRELMARDVTLDLCPTSNVQAALVPSLADHPLPRLLRAGVPVTLSTDDRTVSGLTLTEEWRRAVAVLGLSLDELWAMNLRALRVAFLHHEEPLRERLLREFRALEAELPGLQADGGPRTA